MSDIYTEETTQSLGSRLIGSIKSVALGVVLFLVAFPLLWMNEGRAVKTARSLEEGASSVVSMSADQADAANEGKLVHVTGQATTKDTLTDTVFGVSVPAIQLRRTVEMYQWQEKTDTHKEKNLGGSQTTKKTYSYTKGWSDQVINSGHFKIAAGHENPGQLRYKSETFVAKHVQLGAFRLPERLFRQLTQAVPVSVDARLLPAGLQKHAQAMGDGFYIGKNPAAPQIGDLRISFEKVEPGMVSIVARQQGATFAPYPTQVGQTIEMIKTGQHRADSMFQAALSANTMWTWILRLAGFVVMTIGLSLVVSPLPTLADVIPILGELLRAGTGLASGLMAMVCSLLTISIAWIAYRPVLGTVLLIGAGVVLFGGRRLFGSHSLRTQQPGMPAAARTSAYV